MTKVYCWMTKDLVSYDDPVAVEAAIKTAIVNFWRREAELDGYEKLKLKSLMLNLKAHWLATQPLSAPKPPQFSLTPIR
jgi:hypothetical protein